MSRSLEKVRKQLYKAGVAERLLKNEDFKEYLIMIDEEISYYTNKLVDESTHPKDYLSLRANVAARVKMRRTLEVLVANKGKLLGQQEELEAVEEATSA